MIFSHCGGNLCRLHLGPSGECLLMYHSKDAAFCLTGFSTVSVFQSTDGLCGLYSPSLCGKIELLLFFNRVKVKL